MYEINRKDLEAPLKNLSLLFGRNVQHHELKATKDFLTPEKFFERKDSMLTHKTCRINYCVFCGPMFLYMPKKQRDPILEHASGIQEYAKNIFNLITRTTNYPEVLYFMDCRSAVEYALNCMDNDVKKVRKHHQEFLKKIKRFQAIKIYALPLEMNFVQLDIICLVGDPYKNEILLGTIPENETTFMCGRQFKNFKLHNEISDVVKRLKENSSSLKDTLAKALKELT